MTLSTPVDDADYKIPFPFEGTINNTTYKVDRPKLTPEQEKELQEGTCRSRRTSSQPRVRGHPRVDHRLRLAGNERPVSEPCTGRDQL